MAPTPPNFTEWPADDHGKVLLHLNVGGAVDEVYQDIFGVQSALQFAWVTPPLDADALRTATAGATRKVNLAPMIPPPNPAARGSLPSGALPPHPLSQLRFDAPAGAMGSFSSEEVQLLLAHRPGSHYAVESEVFTTAMYGDKFAVLTRATLAARGPRCCVLHIVYTVADSGLPWLVRPMVISGVDGERRPAVPEAVL
ncbi:hypothetical protein MNEG_7335 [Monoraphidium neglectum]|uniref:VASt domain-containing protein n=1 Tax=Monoraphidium neglectum TaxID=145388 RepID=A0A0D2KZN8_9CHLO|nr:hypothetical protein MNEG_7335 [Monoraphidium neglectum]KIZ00629.1 hypothetical protein MNEG_7335 [Monoraphidium neglectum]|eukprot:XP_013899648.1 hypothetical protein MNEG_7335 [Monoraphidium neglectum]